MSAFYRLRAAAFVLAFLLTTAHAQQVPDLRLSKLTGNSRSHAPLTLDMVLEHWSERMIEGRVELTFRDGNTVIGQCTTGEVALMNGSRRSRIVLPPMTLRIDLSLLSVEARFVSGTTSTELGRFEYRMPAYWKRSFVIGVVVPDDRTYAARDRAAAENLRLEQFADELPAGVGLVSVPAHIDPIGLREDSMDLLSCDIFVLTATGFAALDAAQLNALAGWAEAGGSLVVTVDSTVTDVQREFLHRLQGLASDDPRRLTDSVVADADDQATFRLCRTGPGRVVLLKTPLAMLAEQDVRQVAAFVWKIRAQQLPQLLSQGTWRAPELANPAPYSSWNDSRRVFQPQRLPETDQLASILLPQSVQGIPAGIVAAILVVFLLVIVPLDYYGLGWLGARKYTWILLPLASLAFTAFTALVGRAYLGSTDYRMGLEFVDLGQGDRVVRSSRYELLFTASQRDVVTDVKQSLFTTFPGRHIELLRRDDWDDMNRMQYSSRQAQPGSDTVTADSVLPEYEGQLPSAYVVRQPMQKWSPQLSRQTTLNSDHTIPDLGLDSLEVSGFSHPEQRQELAGRIEAQLPGAVAWLLNRRQVFRLNTDTNDASQQEEADPPLWRLIRAASVRPASGLFSVVSRISPNGAGDFEDLTLLDSSDPNEWLLVILTRQGDDQVVFRRLFYGGHDGFGGD